MQVPRGEVPCTYHPNVQTGLRCTRCGKPICPQCAVRSPVGLRCPDCAGVRSMPSIRTPGSDLLKAIGGGLLVALVVAVIWRFIPDWGFYLSLAMGFGVVETIAKLTRNKRGADLQLLAMALVTIGFLVSRVLLASRYNITFGEINQLSEYAQRALRVRLVPDLVYMALAYAIAWIRFR
jgi:hypothetical protein